MRVGVLGAWTVAAAGAMLVIACGTQLPPAPGDAPATGEDAAPSEPNELALDDFACGPARCRVNVQVCCIAGGGAACRDLAIGCTSPDAGAADGGDAGPPPAPPLTCTTYRNCGGGQQQQSNRDCCWSESQGSKCASDCSGNELALCESSDSCGYDRRCESIPGDPLGPGIGRCVPDGSSTSGSGSSSGWSSGSSSW